jgi:hypothetical protein
VLAKNSGTGRFWSFVGVERQTPGPGFPSKTVKITTRIAARAESGRKISRNRRGPIATRGRRHLAELRPGGGKGWHHSTLNSRAEGRRLVRAPHHLTAPDAPGLELGADVF